MDKRPHSSNERRYCVADHSNSGAISKCWASNAQSPSPLILPKVSQTPPPPIRCMKSTYPVHSGQVGTAAALRVRKFNSSSLKNKNRRAKQKVPGMQMVWQHQRLDSSLEQSEQIKPILKKKASEEGT